MTLKDLTQLFNKSKIEIANLEAQNEELQQHIKTVEKSEEKYRTLFESCNDGIIFINREGNIIEANQAFQNLLCYTIEELKKFTISQLTPKKWHDMENEIIRKGCSCEYEKEYVKKNGAILPVSIKMILPQSEQGNLSNIWCIVKDMSMHKKYEAQLAIEENIEFTKIFASGIAHHFNNILFPIIGYIDIAKTCLLDNDDSTMGMLDEALIAAKRARDLVKSIMNFVLKDQEEKKPIDLSLLLEEYIEFLKSVIPKSITIEKTKAKKIKINGNQKEIRQLFINLGLNAAQSIQDECGKIEIEMDEIEFAEDFPKPHVYLKNGKYVVLTFKDTGNGIKKEMFSKIFAPFFTTQNDVFNHWKGAGLGLTIAEKIVQDHGGAITVDSEVGKGSKFSVFLPQHSS